MIINHKARNEWLDAPLDIDARDGGRTRTPLAGLRILSLDQQNVIDDETLT